MLLPSTDKQFEFWVMRRKGTANITIAQMLGISRQAVSRGLRNMDEKVDTALRDMATANQILMEKISPGQGILVGKSVPFNTAAIIFVSSKHGVQVWYEHDGDCGSCERYNKCIELLWDYASELGIKIGKTAHPTAMAEELFAKVKVMMK